MVQHAGLAGPAVMLLAFALRTLIIARCTALMVLKRLAQVQSYLDSDCTAVRQRAGDLNI